ncbi:hypothetical protein OL548_09435 [Lysinibacillus sp. MHQ-1]|nr:hypothetical protein OL548_09435 [Lysinibacillus sp. MHQ-1]
MNRKLTAGVITSLLLAPTAIANAQENDAQSRATVQTEQVSYVNAVAAATTKEQLIAQFGKLSENSTANEMVIADGDIKVVQNSNDLGFDNNEKALIQAKYDYVVEQRRLLNELQAIWKKISTISYTSKTFIDDVKAVETEYDNFLGNETTDHSYLFVQKQFEEAVDAAFANSASSITNTIRGTVLQYGYKEADRNNYFKGKGVDIAKLGKLVDDAAAVKTTATELDALVVVLKQNPTDYPAISSALDKVTAAYNLLTADQKKVAEAYNPNNDVVTPFKKNIRML